MIQQDNLRNVQRTLQDLENAVSDTFFSENANDVISMTASHNVVTPPTKHHNYGNGSII